MKQRPIHWRGPYICCRNIQTSETRYARSGLVLGYCNIIHSIDYTGLNSLHGSHCKAIRDHIVKLFAFEFTKHEIDCGPRRRYAMPYGPDFTALKINATMAWRNASVDHLLDFMHKSLSRMLHRACLRHSFHHFIRYTQKSHRALLRRCKGCPSHYIYST